MHNSTFLRNITNNTQFFYASQAFYTTFRQIVHNVFNKTNAAHQPKTFATPLVFTIASLNTKTRNNPASNVPFKCFRLRAPRCSVAVQNRSFRAYQILFLITFHAGGGIKSHPRRRLCAVEGWRTIRWITLPSIRGAKVSH